MNRRILLVNPGWGDYISRRGKRVNRAWPPLDLLSCAGQLDRLGFESVVLDLRVTSDPDLPAGEFDKIFVTSSSMDRWQCPNLELGHLKQLLKKFPSDRTYLLGAHGTMDPHRVMAELAPAGLIGGEPELAVAALARGDEPSTIPGLTFRRDDQIHVNPPGQVPPMDELAAPAYDLIDVSEYSYELMGERFALLETSRGCPHSCSFCYLGMYPQFRLKSPARIVEEVKQLLKLGARNIYFIDLEFAIQHRHCEAVLDALLESGLEFRWCCQTRADSVDEHLLLKMHRAGCRLIHFGVEAGSERIAKMTHKRLDLKAVREAIRMTQAIGIDTACFFMFGFPTETHGEIQETFQLARELNPDYASFHLATPYPGTTLRDEFQPDSEKRFIPESFSEALPLAELKRLQRRAYLSYYLRPQYLLTALKHPDRSLRQFRLFWQLVTA